jgi:ABC-2 type transport system ATP-binding protein
MHAIELDRLTKRYGAARGIDEVSLQVPEGAFFGFIGPNGAGKSTTIRTLLGLLRPTAGSARLLGRPVVAGDPGVRRDLGYVPGEIHLYDDLRAGEVLDYLGSFHPGDHRTRRRELLATFDLDPARRAADLSLGNRKKVALIAALQHRPRLVVLDEPTSGLDPVIQAQLFEVLTGEVRRGTTVFFSSHVLAEVQRTCERVAVIRAGRLVAVDEVARLRGARLRRVHLTFAAPPADLPLARLPGLQGLVREGTDWRFLYGGPAPELLGALAAAAPLDVRIEEPSLDEIFLDYYAPARAGGSHG